MATHDGRLTGADRRTAAAPASTGPSSPSST